MNLGLADGVVPEEFSLEDPQADPLAARLVEQTAAHANGDVGHWLRIAFQATRDGRRAEARALLDAALARFPLESRVRHDLGRLEEAEGNWSAAECHWRAFAALSPGVWWGQTQIARALREQGQVAEADTLLAGLRDQFPQEAGVFIDHARIAELQRNWPEAGARWATVAERFPAIWEGPAGQARALREQGEPDAARVVLVDTVARFPAEGGPLHDLAQLEEAQRNWPEAERRWRAFVALNPAIWWGHTRLAATLREQGRMAEAEALLAGVLDDFAEEAGPSIEYARMAEFRLDWPEAGARWAAVTERFPRAWEGLTGRARALREQGQTDAARALLLQAMDRFSSEAGPLHELARLEEAERNWPEAERAWRGFTALHPAPWWGHAGLATALMEQGRQAEAESGLTERFELLANDPGVFIAHAMLADRRRDWPEAERRWTHVATRFPHVWDGHGGLVRSLREQQRLEEAEAVLAQTSDRFPGQHGPLLERAAVAEARGDRAAAETAWRGLITMDKPVWWFYTRLFEAESKQGRMEDASATFARARQRFPDDMNIIIAFLRALLDGGCLERARRVIDNAFASTNSASPPELMHLARLALQCEELDRAIDFVHRLHRSPPGDRQIAEDFRRFENVLKVRIAEHAPEKLARLGEHQHVNLTSGAASGEAVVPGASDDASACADMMRFESLGGDYPGCEIGLVQRTFGAEPLGLLRWTTVAPDRLIEAIQVEFEGVGSPDQTELVAAPSGDYKTKDSRFGFDMMTFCGPSDIEFSKMRERALKRISFLREKLIRDLTDSDKIFVYRTLDDTMSVSDVKRLKAAMGRYGRNKLLYIKRADGDNPVGSIRIEAPDLCFGYVERFSREPVAVLYLNGWRSVFDKAHAVWPLPRPDEAPALTEAPPPAPAVQPPAKHNSWVHRASSLIRSLSGVGGRSN